jgi:hypothetical protein
VLPPRHVINQMLGAGAVHEQLRWDAFEIDETEYRDLVAQCIRAGNGYCIEDSSLWAQPDYVSWYRALRSKFKCQPRYKRLEKWTVQNDLIGMPVGPDSWLVVQDVDDTLEQLDISAWLEPVRFLFHRLETACDRACCRLSAYDLRPECIRERFSPADARDSWPELQALYCKLDALPGTIQVFQTGNEVFNTLLMRGDLLKIIGHVLFILRSQAARGSTDGLGK